MPGPTRIALLLFSIALTLTDDDGYSIQFFEYVYPRNVMQNTGKRVR